MKAAARRWRNSSTRGRTEEIIFTRNATEAINLVASSWGEPNIKAGDEIVISIMEHHSNIVPWHFLRERHGAVIKWAPVDDEGNFLIDEFEKLLTDRTKLVAITQMSNALGTIVPVKDVVKIAHARGIPVLVDGSQAAVHLAVDVQQDIDADFYVFTGHKLYGPTGIGVLYAKHEHLVAMRPFQWRRRDDPRSRKRLGQLRRSAAQIRGRHTRDREIDGLGAAIDYVNSMARRASPRTSMIFLTYAQDPLARSIRWADRHRAGQGSGDLVRNEGRPCPRRRHRDRPAGHRRSRRHPLCDAAFRAVQRHGDVPRLVRDV